MINKAVVDKLDCRAKPSLRIMDAVSDEVKHMINSVCM